MAAASSSGAYDGRFSSVQSPQRYPMDRPSTDMVTAVDCVERLSPQARAYLDALGADASQLELSAKVVCVGEMAVGKTSLLIRACRDTFSDRYKSTISVDFLERHYRICGVPFSLFIWDTAGQERLRSASKSFYRGARGALICYDVSSIKSLKNIKSWHRELRENCQQTEVDVPFVSLLVGCKADLEHQVTPSKGKSLAEELQAEWAEVSAKDGSNVKALFDGLAIRLFEQELLLDKAKMEMDPLPLVGLPPHQDGGQRAASYASIGQPTKPVKPKKRKCCGGSK